MLRDTELPLACESSRLSPEGERGARRAGGGWRPEQQSLWQRRVRRLAGRRSLTPAPKHFPQRQERSKHG